MMVDSSVCDASWYKMMFVIHNTGLIALKFKKTVAEKRLQFQELDLGDNPVRRILSICDFGEYKKHNRGISAVELSDEDNYIEALESKGRNGT